MPTYAYACTECEHRFDIVQSFSDDALTECPECGGRLRKLFNAVGVVFKGSGFYRTDSRSAGSATTPAASGASNSGGASTASSGGASASGATGTSTASSGASSSGSGSSTASTATASSGASSTSD